jgi:hypothetical protein
MAGFCCETCFGCNPLCIVVYGPSAGGVRSPLPGWQNLTASEVETQTRGETVTKHELWKTGSSGRQDDKLRMGDGWGEWAGRSRYDDMEGHPVPPPPPTPPNARTHMHTRAYAQPRPSR